MRRHRPSCLVALFWLTGCAPGHLSWPTGDDPLQTARYVEQVHLGDTRAAVFLSTSHFRCGFPSFSDPQRQTEALVELTTAACREDARHVILLLDKRPGQGWEGRYPGREDELDVPLPLGVPRGSQARYVGIEEAAADRDFGLYPEHEPLDVTFEGPMVRGEAVVRRDDGDALHGWFEFPEADISGTFHATRCDEDTSLVDALLTGIGAGCF